MKKDLNFYELNYELSAQEILSSDGPVIERQIKVLEEIAGVKFEKKGVRQIITCKMKDIFVVYEDGKVLKNFEPYEVEEIDGIFEASPDFFYVIYKNGVVGSLYPEDEAVFSGKYDKILFDKNFLLLLREDTLIILSCVWGKVCDRDDEETSVFTTYTGVSDMKLIHNWEVLEEEPGDKMIETSIMIKVGNKWLTMVGAPMMHSISVA